MATQFKLRRNIDGSVATIGIIMSLFGLVMVLSASQFVASQSYGSPYYFFIRQVIAWAAGMVLFFYFLRVNLEQLYEQRLTYFIATLVLLVLVLLIGSRANGATRWFDLGVVRLQPAEFAKLFLTIYFAGWFATKGEKIKSFRRGLLPFFGVLAVVGGLIMLEPDMGTMLVVIILLMSMFFVARAHLAHFFGIIAVGILAVVLLIYAAPYRAQRLESFLGKNSTTTQDSLGSSYHNYQALVAIGSGGWWGEGFGRGISKYSYLPEAQTDSIFAVIAEELGFIRTALVVIAYAFIAWRGYVITQNANSLFAKYLACGLTTAITAQTLINIGGMLNVIPLTGIPLPFISYGGSSMIVCLSMLGLLTNVSREVV